MALSKTNFSSKQNSKLLVTLGGNIGNQLFQLAGALTLVDGDFQRLLLDYRLTYLCNGPQLHQLVTPSCLNVARRSDLIRFGLWPFRCLQNATIHHLFQKTANLSGHLRTFHSDPIGDQVHVDEYSSRCEMPTQIMGYFGHMKWVRGSSKYLLPNILSASDPVNLNKLGVSIRRRDDFAGNRLLKGYYESAAMRMSAIHPDIDEVIITGDLDGDVGIYDFTQQSVNNLCRKQWPIQFNVLSTCGLSILSNSTFAWWAAWIAHNRRQVACSDQPHTYFPDDWFPSSLTDIQGWAPIERGDLW